MSPEYLKGIRRILTVSADTELISAPAYLRAAQHAPSAEQLRLRHLDHPGRARPRPHRLPAARRPRRRQGRADLRARPAAFKYPYAFDVPLDSWHELVMANALYDQAGLRAAVGRPPLEHVRAVEARAGQGRQGGDVPPAPRPQWIKKLCADPDEKPQRPGRGRLDVHPDARVVRAARRPKAARHAARVRLQGHEQRPAAPGVDGARWCRSWTRSASTCPPTATRRALGHRLPFPAAFDAEAQALAARRRADLAGTR